MEVLRIVAFQERWQCLSEEGCALDPADAAPLSQAPRIAPTALHGDWKVFDVSAVPVEETDVETGALSERLRTVSRHMELGHPMDCAASDNGSGL